MAERGEHKVSEGTEFGCGAGGHGAKGERI